MFKKLLADPRCVFIGVMGLTLGTIAVGVTAPAFIEGATRKQCLNRDWPAEKHLAHMAFCEYHKYSTSLNHSTLSN